MAVAWSKDKVGRASGDVTVRDPVVLTATLPRFLLTGDRSTHAPRPRQRRGPGGRLQRHGQRARAPSPSATARTQTLQLRAKQRSSVTVPLTASAAGAAQPSRSRITGPGGFALERSYAMAVKPATQMLTRRTVKPIAKGESLTLSSDLFADLVPGTGAVALSVGASTALDAATLLKALDRYPFGCSEQITSRALPLLYVNELASAAHLALDDAIDQRIRDAIDRVLARQSSNGSFGLWGVGGDDAWLDAYVTDFLTRARERGFAVPDTAFKLALDRLRNIVATAPDAVQGRRPQSRLCALCAGAQRRRAARRSALSRRRQARRSRHADRQGAGRRGARPARRPHPRGAGLQGRARRPQAADAAGAVQPSPTTARRCATPRRW